MNTVATKQHQQEERPVRQQQQPVAEERMFVSPKVNINENKDGYVLQVEMPGVSKTGLEINLEDNDLTITGRRERSPALELLYRESSPADYRRVFELDPSIEAGKISAQIDQGILTLTLPKAEKIKPRRITVN